MNLISSHVQELVQLISLTPTTYHPQPNNVDPEKYWRYFSKFPNEFASGLALKLKEQQQEFLSYDHLQNTLTIQ